MPPHPAAMPSIDALSTHVITTGDAMPVIVDDHQADAWNGYQGHHRVDHHERHNAVNDGLNEAVHPGASRA
ncbi:hypothetical protein Psi02_30690 [Planotetraspora silvatica]|uniref:Uncharacterized protein n=1 Tax=Planotetraspora silvatica TaxID=234614 RepID=A0A8J3ULI8_9ACTN|nr:hypothetical protein Psi02_30690 [Planotetraspora silvatica]